MRSVPILALVLLLPSPCLPSWILYSNVSLGSSTTTLTPGQQPTVTADYWWSRGTCVKTKTEPCNPLQPQTTSFNFKVLFDPVELAISNIDSGYGTGTFSSSINTSDFAVTWTGSRPTLTDGLRYTLFSFVITAKNNAQFRPSDLIVTTGTTVNGSAINVLGPAPGPTYDILKDLRVTVEAPAGAAPEPGTMGLLLAGIPLAGLGWLRRKRK